jgi:RNA polymerase sigma factor (sigma-70 family)
MLKHKSVVDQQLVSDYLNGKEEALAILITRHQKKIYSFIYNYTKSPEVTEDLFQDTFFKVVHQMKSGKYNEEGKFLSWVLKISHSLTIDYLRKEAQLPFNCSGVNRDGEEYDVFNLIIVDNQNAESKMEQQQMRKQLRILIGQLPKEQSELLILRYYYKMSYKEISQLLSINQNTALARMHYAIINLRKKLEKKNSLVQ